jgi:hypothetical protein
MCYISVRDMFHLVCSFMVHMHVNPRNVWRVWSFNVNILIMMKFFCQGQCIHCNFYVHALTLVGWDPVTEPPRSRGCFIITVLLSTFSVMDGGTSYASCPEFLKTLLKCIPASDRTLYFHQIPPNMLRSKELHCRTHTPWLIRGTVLWIQQTTLQDLNHFILQIMPLDTEVNSHLHWNVVHPHWLLLCTGYLLDRYRNPLAQSYTSRLWTEWYPSHGPPSAQGLLSTSYALQWTVLRFTLRMNPWLCGCTIHH